MTKTDLELFLKQNIALDLNNFLFSLFTAALLSLLIQLFYLKFSSTLSNKFEFSKNFIILGIATTIVITIVKSSLALSLGLVGALSIVRFRAAIKEPEELVYLFLVIATGLGCGAGQVKITVIGIFFSLITIFIYSLFYKKNRLMSSEILNLAIIKNESMNQKEIDDLIKEIGKHVDQIELISFSKSNDNTTINFDVKTKDFSKVNRLINQIQKNNTKVVVARNDLTTL
jgi:hypothetical protein|tara:strand:- start:205 stop:891 length:687 start_codon:yes stop_codon:yes gene_type:complete